MIQNSKAWLTMDEIAEVVAGEYWSAGSRSPMAIPPSVAEDVAQRIATASKEKAKRLQESDPMTYLGTNAAQADKAFQGLQEASKDLVDLEIVIPAGYRTEADQKVLDALPKGPSFHAPQRPVLRGGLILNENQRPPKEPDIDKALSDLFREPWYKRLWDLVASPFRIASAVEAQIRQYDEAGIWGHDDHPDIVSAKLAHGIFRPVPWYKRLWSWPTGPEDRPLTDSELQKASEDLDRILRLPAYKRIPALILWLWRLP